MRIQAWHSQSEPRRGLHSCASAEQGQLSCTQPETGLTTRVTGCLDPAAAALSPPACPPADPPHPALAPAGQPVQAVPEVPGRVQAQAQGRARGVALELPAAWAGRAAPGALRGCCAARGTWRRRARGRRAAPLLMSSWARCWLPLHAHPCFAFCLSVLCEGVCASFLCVVCCVLCV